MVNQRRIAKVHLFVLLLSLAKAARGLKEQTIHYDSDHQYNVSGGDLSEGILIRERDGGDQNSLPWRDLEELAELERSAEYTIKVIILTMNR